MPLAAPPRVAGVLVLARRIAAALATVWVATLVVFAAVEILPQDPAMAALGPESTPEQRAAFRERMRLDDPPVDRYLRWAGGMAQGDFGQSVVTGRPIAGQLLFRFRYTAILAVSAIVLSMLIALPLAIVVAQRAGGVLDLLTTSSALAISAVPEYIIAIVLLLVTAAQLRLFPVVSAEVTEGAWIGLVLPTLTLALVAASYVFRLARVSIIETMAAPYVRTAVLRGFSRGRVLWWHVLPNASVVVVNVVALNAIYLLGGVIVVENVFAYPGLGTLLLEAVSTKDFTLVEGIAVVMSGLLVGINLLADTLVLLLDPRLRARG